METAVALEEASEELEALARRAEAGEHIVLTRGGEPVLDLIPHPQRKKGAIDWEAGRRFKEKHGITEFFPYVAPDFDDPLPEDFLLRPLPDAPSR
jgi:antitoxin (DNA-binding transcriptional repressor) of toxin-antitoxin stability system